MVAVLKEQFQPSLKELSLLDVGGSGGIIDNYLADHFGSVVSVDIDGAALDNARKNFRKKNLSFLPGDALDLQFSNDSFDVVICSQVYEHVTDPEKMMDEIFRVLKPNGICYFAAGNRLMWKEPHYKLPLLSVLPRRLAHLYIRFTGKADHYHEFHYTYWGLQKLVKRFIVHDITLKLICDPVKYRIDYLVPNGRIKSLIARFIAGKLIWLTPGYIWLLKKDINNKKNC